MHKDLRKLAKRCAKWRIKLNPEKTKVITFSRSSLTRNSEPVLKLYGKRLKIYPKVKFLGITFDSKFTFQSNFEEILGHCNTRYHQIKLLVNKKWGPAHPPYYKSINNVSGQFSNMAPFRPLQHQTQSSAKFNSSRTNLSGLPCV